MAQNVKTKKEKKNLRPSVFIWFIYTVLAKVFLFFKHRFYNKNKEFKKRDKKAGCVVLYNHCSNRDHIITTAAFNFRRTNYVITKHFYFNPTLNKMLRIVKAIPREQFKSDMVSIRQIKKALENKNIVSIAPAGQVSINGDVPYIDRATIKLLRFCKTDVYTAQIHGNYLAYPKWSRSKRNFPIHTEFVSVLKKEELATLTDDEIYKRVVDSLDVNDRVMQKEKPRKIRGKRLAEGLETILYYCPKCGHKYELTSHHNEFTCNHCHNTAIMNKYGFLEGKGDDYVIFENEAEWYNYEKELLKKQILKGELNIQNRFKLLRNINEEWRLDEVGDGNLVLTDKEFYYEGTINGEKVRKNFVLETMIQLPFKPAHHLDVPDDEGTFEFLPITNPNMVIEYVQAIDVMREIRHNKAQKVNNG